jgi:hypothetical protein
MLKKREKSLRNVVPLIVYVTSPVRRPWFRLGLMNKRSSNAYVALNIGSLNITPEIPSEPSIRQGRKSGSPASAGNGAAGAARLPACWNTVIHVFWPAAFTASVPNPIGLNTIGLDVLPEPKYATGREDSSVGARSFTDSAIGSHIPRSLGSPASRIRTNT